MSFTKSKQRIKVPTSLIGLEALQNTLELDGCTLIEQCIHSTEVRGTMYLEQHLLLIVLEETVVLTYGKQEYTVGKNDMILLKKATAVKYHKFGNTEMTIFMTV